MKEVGGGREGGRKQGKEGGGRREREGGREGRREGGREGGEGHRYVVSTAQTSPPHALLISC